MTCWPAPKHLFTQASLLKDDRQLCSGAVYSELTDVLSPWLCCLKEREVPSSARTRMYPEFQNTTSRFHEEGWWQYNSYGQVSRRKVSGKFWIHSVVWVFFLIWTLMKNIMMCNCLTRSRNRSGSLPVASALNEWKEPFRSHTATPQIMSTQETATAFKLVLEG